MHGRLYHEIDKTWIRYNRVNSVYMAFEQIYDFLAARIVAYSPGLVPFMHGQLDLKGYITGAELVNSLIGQCSWFIHVMPSIATLKANARRVTDLAQRDRERPAAAGILPADRPLRFPLSARQNPVFGLTVAELELMHQGEDAAPFLSAANLRFRRGEWTFLKGESGSGKTA